MIHVSKIGCVNIPCMDSHYPRPVSCFHPHQCQQFHQVSSADIPTYYTFPPTISYTMPLWHCSALGPTREAKRLCPSSSLRFLCGPFFLAYSKGVLPGNHSWHSNWPLPIYHISFQVINVRTAHCSHCLMVHIVHIVSGNCKDMDELQNYLFQQNVLRWSQQRHAPKSRLLNFKETFKMGTWDDKSSEIPCPLKLKEPEISYFL